MPVELIDDPARWDGFIDESADGTLFHKWEFLRILEKYTGYQLFRYGVYRGEDLISVIPVFYTKSIGLKLIYSPPPTSSVNIPYLGFATSPLFGRLGGFEREECWSQIVKEFRDEVMKISPNYMTIGLVPGIRDVRPFLRNDCDADLMYTYIIDLKPPLISIWEGIDRYCRKDIRAAAKYPLVMRRSYDAYKFVELMREGLKKLGRTFYDRQSPAYIEEILRAFPDNVKLFFLYDGDALIGANLVCGFKKRCIGWMGNTTTDNGFNANDYMLWEIIKAAKQEGYESLENAGADEKRLNFAKTKFNPDLVPCFNITKKDIIYKTAKYANRKLEKLVRF